MVIPCLNEAPHIGRLLTAVATQTVPVREVVVVDIGSTDATMERVEEIRARVPAFTIPLLRRPGVGIAEAVLVVAGALINKPSL
ncbi:MAG: glycosyltransferase [Acidobacteriota bacterium]|nr:glycosyltransferase [Acidobacteriota bacterium]